MSFPPDDDFRFLDDLYAVPSTGESDDGCILLLDPKNARCIFYVHINRLLVHICAFDPVHIGLLLFAKRTTVRRATWRNGCLKIESRCNLAPLAGRGRRRSAAKSPGEGDYRRVGACREAPSPARSRTAPERCRELATSPRKRGEVKARMRGV